MLKLPLSLPFHPLGVQKSCLDEASADSSAAKIDDVFVLQPFEYLPSPWQRLVFDITPCKRPKRPTPSQQTFWQKGAYFWSEGVYSGAWLSIRT